MTMLLCRLLETAPSVVSVELRPPHSELTASAGIDAWIDTYHSVTGFARDGMPVFLTDSAVGVREEHNLRHLVVNLGQDVPRERVVPFLTSKHSMEFCLNYAERAWHEGFTSLVVLGGDKSVGAPRCVEHAWQLREAIHAHVPELSLGGWANPHANPEAQASFVADAHFNAQFYLTQIVSHHDRPKVAAFLEAAAARGVTLPGIFGVFYYRSANPKTLETLNQFIPVPVAPLSAEFAAGATPEDVCARTIRELRAVGVKHIYVSNLPIRRAKQTLAAILARV
jgi:5,10-methylenetetrahydrofolate reductase